jgi:hypothetical protein
MDKKWNSKLISLSNNYCTWIRTIFKREIFTFMLVNGCKRDKDNSSNNVRKTGFYMKINVSEIMLYKQVDRLFDVVKMNGKNIKNKTIISKNYLYNLHICTFLDP